MPSLTTNMFSQFPQALERAEKIKLLVLDVDGVLTNGSLFINEDGQEHFKQFNSLDGHGLKLLTSNGVEVAIITGRTSAMVSQRANSLNINIVLMGVEHKLSALNSLVNSKNLTLAQVAVMGDDWPDLAMLKIAGLAIAPAQAHTEVRNAAHFIASKDGGEGAVREACDLLLMAQGHYQRLIMESLV